MSLFKKNIFRNVDTRLVTVLAVFYTIFDLVYVFKIAYFRSLYDEKMQHSWFDILFKNILIDWVVVVAFMTLIAVSTKSLINRKVPWSYIFIIHLVFSVLLGIAIRFVVIVVEMFLDNTSLSDFNVKDHISKFISVLDLNFLIYAAMICIIYAYYYLEQIKVSQKKQAVLESQLVNTKMKMLTAQLRPHFLFNTLNCISALTETNHKDAQDTIADLSEFLRRILYGENTNTITLSEELQTLDYYLNILKVRFSENLFIKKSIDASLANKQVPSLLLQPIIENSVKYGYSYENPKLEIVIDIQRIEESMEIKIANDGKLLTESKTTKSGGMGLSNLEERLYNLYGNNYALILRNNKNNDGVETIIHIPLNPS